MVAHKTRSREKMAHTHKTNKKLFQDLGESRERFFHLVGASWREGGFAGDQKTERRGLGKGKTSDSKETSRNEKINAQWLAERAPECRAGRCCLSQHGAYGFLISWKQIHGFPTSRHSVCILPARFCHSPVSLGCYLISHSFFFFLSFHLFVKDTLYHCKWTISIFLWHIKINPLDIEKTN